MRSQVVFLTPENFHPLCPNFVTAGGLQKKKNSITDWLQLLILRQHETLIIEMTFLGAKTDIAFISLISCSMFGCTAMEVKPLDQKNLTFTLEKSGVKNQKNWAL